MVSEGGLRVKLLETEWPHKAWGGEFGGPLGAFTAARGNWATAFAEGRVVGLFGLLGELAGAMLEVELKRTRDADCDCKK